MHKPNDCHGHHPHHPPYPKPHAGHAHFAPHLVHTPIPPHFRFWCQSVLPTVYDDSLSYYELLNKCVNYINGLIGDDKIITHNIGDLWETYVQLEKYVNDYFDNYQNRALISWDKPITSENYAERLPDLDTAMLNTVFRLYFEDGTTAENLPLNLPKAFYNWKDGAATLFSIYNFYEYDNNKCECECCKDKEPKQDRAVESEQPELDMSYCTQFIIRDNDMYYRYHDKEKWLEWVDISPDNTVMYYETVITNDNASGIIADCDSALLNYVFTFDSVAAGTVEHLPKLDDNIVATNDWTGELWTTGTSEFKQQWFLMDGVVVPFKDEMYEKTDDIEMSALFTRTYKNGKWSEWNSTLTWVKTLNDVFADLKRFYDEYQAFKTSFEEWKALVDTNIQNLNQWKGETDDRINSLYEWKDLTDERINKLNTWKGETDERINKLNAWKDETDTHINNIYSTLETHAENIENNLNAIKQLESRATAIEGEIATINNWRDETDERIKTLQEWKTQTDERIRVLQEWKGETDERIKVLQDWKGTIDTWKGSIDEWKTTTEQWKTQIDQWKSDTDDRLDTLESWKTQTDTAIQELQTWKTQTDTAIQELQAWKTQTDKNISDLQTWKTQTDKNITELQTWKGTVDTNIQNLNEWKTQTDEAIKALQTWKNSTDDAIRALQEWKSTVDTNIQNLNEWKSTAEKQIQTLINGNALQLSVFPIIISQYYADLIQNTIEHLPTNYIFTFETANVITDFPLGAEPVFNDGLKIYNQYHKWSNNTGSVSESNGIKLIKMRASERDSTSQTGIYDIYYLSIPMQIHNTTKDYKGERYSNWTEYLYFFRIHLIQGYNGTPWNVYTDSWYQINGDVYDDTISHTIGKLLDKDSNQSYLRDQVRWNGNLNTLIIDPTLRDALSTLELNNKLPHGTLNEQSKTYYYLLDGISQTDTSNQVQHFNGQFNLTYEPFTVTYNIVGFYDSKRLPSQNVNMVFNGLYGNSGFVFNSGLQSLMTDTEAYAVNATFNNLMFMIAGGNIPMFQLKYSFANLTFNNCIFWNTNGEGEQHIMIFQNPNMSLTFNNCYFDSTKGGFTIEMNGDYAKFNYNSNTNLKVFNCDSNCNVDFVMNQDNVTGFPATSTYTSANADYYYNYNCLHGNGSMINIKKQDLTK